MEVINNIYLIEIYGTQLYGINKTVKDKILVQLLDICEKAFEFNHELHSPERYENKTLYYVKLLDCEKTSEYKNILNKTLLLEPYKTISYSGEIRHLYNPIDLGKYSEKTIKNWKILYGSN